LNDHEWPFYVKFSLEPPWEKSFYIVFTVESVDIMRDQRRCAETDRDQENIW